MSQPRSAQTSPRIGAPERAQALEEMTTGELDVLVIGGGIVGAGTALDAASRGLRTGLIEARDWGSGTSSRSSKLVHGGIRYLQQLNFSLVREALIERGLLMQRIAPHLVKPVRFLYPLTVPVIERLYVGLGMLLYDIFARTGRRPPGLPHHRHLSRRQLELAMPSLKPGTFFGGLSYWDAQVDDARYLVTLVRTAAAHGALVANRTEAVQLLREGDRVVGAVVRDALTGQTRQIRARIVINATGVWTEETQALAATDDQLRVRASKGIHIVVPRDRIRSTMGILLGTEKSVLFVIPWGSHWLIGTTDTPWTLDKAYPVATAFDIDYLLSQVNRVLETPLTRADVQGVFAGLRPLLAGDAADTARLSREHLVREVSPGLITVAGGKWTTYRVMAKDAIDLAVRKALPGAPKSLTDQLPLTGAAGVRALWKNREKLAADSGLSVKRVERLINRYGTHIAELLEMIAADDSLASPLPGAPAYIEAEVVYAASHEGALHLDDVLERRLRVSFESWDSGLAAAPVVAARMQHQLGWDDAHREQELDAYVRRVEAERASQREFTDDAATSARLQTIEVGAQQP